MANQLVRMGNPSEADGRITTSLDNQSEWNGFQRIGQSVLHQLSVNLLLFQRDASDQRERVWQTERKLEVGCGPAALRLDC